ncbi:unnamed protein product [Heligmosomoides polygyrus]|uniref:Secreted protein n=1 Tax=Heligmosomoides polygyrus TaxID=6339 RepID=A0A183G8R3_HELPZ|nr:unnamed protein product [Heligmosomoides polygyrus]
MAFLVIDFLLDGFGLGVQELDSIVEQLIRNPTWYWTHLGRTVEERAGAHEERVTAKAKRGRADAHQGTNQQQGDEP